MKGRWQVTSNPMFGKMFYGVYRLLDVNAPDHSGNREFAGEFTPDEEAAEKLAKKLNRGEAGEETVEEKKACPRCGREMEDFAVAWGWRQCYQCSVKDADERREKDAGDELRRN